MNNLMKLVILICMFVIFSGCTEETVKPILAKSKYVD